MFHLRSVYCFNFEVWGSFHWNGSDKCEFTERQSFVCLLLLAGLWRALENQKIIDASVGLAPGQ